MHDHGRGMASGWWATRGVAGYGRGMASPLRMRARPENQRHRSDDLRTRHPPPKQNPTGVGARPCLARRRAAADIPTHPHRC